MKKMFLALFLSVIMFITACEKSTIIDDNSNVTKSISNSTKTGYSDSSGTISAESTVPNSTEPSEIFNEHFEIDTSSRDSANIIGFIDEENVIALVSWGATFGLVNMNNGEIAKQAELYLGNLDGREGRGSNQVILMNNCFAVLVNEFLSDTNENTARFHIYDFNFNLIEVYPIESSGVFDDDLNLITTYDPATENSEGFYKIDRAGIAKLIWSFSTDVISSHYTYYDRRIFMIVSPNQSSNQTEGNIAYVIGTEESDVKHIQKDGITTLISPYVRGNYALWIDELVDGSFTARGLASGTLLLFNIANNEFETLKTQYTNESNNAVLSYDGKYVITALNGKYDSGGELPDGTNIINVYDAVSKELVRTFNCEHDISTLLASNSGIIAQTNNGFYVYKI